jgi:hypothetical protein
VLKKCRPDWDITTPELKEAWQQGARTCSTLMAKPTPKFLRNRIRSGIAGRRCCSASA